MDELQAMRDELAEIYGVLGSYKAAIDALIERVDALGKENDELRSVLFDEILAPAKEAFDADAKEKRYEAWHERHGAVLDPYNEQLRAIEGDDFDLARTAMDGYEAIEDGEGKPTEDDYVAALVEKVKAQLETIRGALGASEVKAEANADGTVEVSADGGEVGVNVDGADGASADGASADGASAAAETPTDTPEEVKAYEDELEKELAQYK